MQQRLRLLETVSQKVGARSPEELEARVDSVLAEMETLRRELQRRQQQQAHDAAGTLAERRARRQWRERRGRVGRRRLTR